MNSCGDVVLGLAAWGSVRGGVTGMGSVRGTDIRLLVDLLGADPMNAPAGTAVIGTKGDNLDMMRPVCSGLSLVTLLLRE